MTFKSTLKHYTYSDNFYKKSAEISRCLPEKAEAREYCDAIIEPLIMKRSDSDVRQGGVCAEDFEFIAGQRRDYDKEISTRSCLESYRVPDKKLLYSDEEVVFGGILCEHFGHMLLDTISRLWYFVQCPEETRRVAFVTLPKKSTIEEGDYHFTFLKLAGIDPEKVLIVDKPTQFSKVIVPDETIFPQGEAYFKEEFKLVLSRIRDAVKPGPYKKIYFTRTGYMHKNPIVGEEYFENLYRDMGFEIISPEKYSLEEQIGFIAGAREFACSEGTLSLFAMYSHHLKMTVFKRSHVETYGMASLAELTGADINLIEIHKNFLPESQGHGVYLVGPNSCWERYLEDNPDVAAYAKKQIYDPAKCSWQYVNMWADFINKDSIVKATSRRELKDIIYSSNLYLLNKRIKKKAFKAPDFIVKQQREYIATMKRIKKVQANMFENSISTNRSWIEFIDIQDNYIVAEGRSSFLFANHKKLDISLGTSYSIFAPPYESFSVIEQKESYVQWEIKIQFDTLGNLSRSMSSNQANDNDNDSPFFIIARKDDSEAVSSPIFCSQAISALFEECGEGECRCIRVGSHSDNALFDINYVSYVEAFKNNVSLMLQTVHPKNKGFELSGRSNIYSSEQLDFALVLADEILGFEKSFPISISFEEGKARWRAYFPWEDIYELSRDFPQETFGLQAVLKKGDVEVAYAFKQPVDLDILVQFKALAQQDPYGNYIFPSQSSSKVYEFRFKTLEMVLNQKPSALISDFSFEDNTLLIWGGCKSLLSIDDSFRLDMIFKSIESPDNEIAVPAQVTPNFRRGFFVEWRLFIDDTNALDVLLKESGWGCFLRISCRDKKKIIHLNESNIDEEVWEKMQFGFKYKNKSFFFLEKKNKLNLRVNSLLKRISKRFGKLLK